MTIRSVTEEPGSGPDNSLVEAETAAHWDGVYADHPPSAVSWFQPVPALSLQLIELLGMVPESAVIDVGGGASLLVDALLGRGFDDISILDVSATALERGRRRVGPTGGDVDSR